MGTDHTLFAKTDGRVLFETKRGRAFVTVVPVQEAAE
jgi:large subunit ribosomal protein L27